MKTKFALESIFERPSTNHNVFSVQNHFFQVKLMRESSKLFKLKYLKVQ